jgi:hypothetical protein
MFTEAEAAAAFGSTPKQLIAFLKKSKGARSAFQTGRLRTLEALRRAQFKHAQTNASMAMFLGRTYLGQAEQREGEDGAAAFDISGAGRRLRAKVAAIAAAASSERNRESDRAAG